MWQAREYSEYFGKIFLHVAGHGQRSSPSSLRSFLPPDFINGSLQGILHWSLAETCNVIIGWGNILRQISNDPKGKLKPRRRLTISHFGFTVVTVRM